MDPQHNNPNTGSNLLEHLPARDKYVYVFPASHPCLKRLTVAILGYTHSAMRVPDPTVGKAEVE